MAVDGGVRALNDGKVVIGEAVLSRAEFGAGGDPVAVKGTAPRRRIRG